MYQNFSFLFSERGAKFVPNEKYSSRNGVVHATVEVGNIRFKAVSFRDGFYMEVAALQEPNQWEEVSTVLKAINLEYAANPAENIPTYLPMSSLAALLRRNLHLIQEGLSTANYAATWRATQTVKRMEDEQYMRQMEERVRESRSGPEPLP